jgi:hypothetical protein
LNRQIFEAVDPFWYDLILGAHSVANLADTCLTTITVTDDKNYERQTVLWRLSVADADGELVIIVLHEHHDEWRTASVARLEVIDQHIVRIVDYAHCAWVLSAATSVVSALPS